MDSNTEDKLIIFSDKNGVWTVLLPQVSGFDEIKGDSFEDVVEKAKQAVEYWLECWEKIHGTDVPKL